MTFLDWLKNYRPEYQIDPENETQILAVSAWVNRDPNFEKMGQYFNLNRGLFFVGNIGTGKTDLMMSLKKYLQDYLKSSLKFRMHVAWAFADGFEKDGYKAFDGQSTENRCYDELCLVDDRNQKPTREYVSHFGNKMLVGEELIMTRYNVFKSKGYMTHFTSNAMPAQLMEIYGERAYDRLMEMCNFIVFTGPSRRWANAPKVYSNPNAIKQEATATPMTDQEHVNIKASFDEAYHAYLAGEDLSERLGIMYYGLKSYGCSLDENFHKYKEEGRRCYAIPLGRIVSATATEEEKERAGVLYASRRCVAEFFESMKAAGAKTIFGVVSVDIDKLVKKEQ